MFMSFFLFHNRTRRNIMFTRKLPVFAIALSAFMSVAAYAQAPAAPDSGSAPAVAAPTPPAAPEAPAVAAPAEATAPAASESRDAKKKEHMDRYKSHHHVTKHQTVEE